MHTRDSSFLASRLAALPLDARTEEEELKKKRDCSQSTGVGVRLTFLDQEAILFA